MAQGCRGPGSGREEREGLSHLDGASCLPQLPPLLSGLASLERRQMSTCAVGTALCLSCASLPCLLRWADMGKGERVGRQRHSLKMHARAEHRGNHHPQRTLSLLLSLAPNSSGRGRRIMNAISLTMLWASVPGMAPVWVGSGCFPISSSLRFSEDYDLMWCEKKGGFAHLLCS